MNYPARRGGWGPPLLVLTAEVDDQANITLLDPNGVPWTSNTPVSRPASTPSTSTARRSTTTSISSARHSFPVSTRFRRTTAPRSSTTFPRNVGGRLPGRARYIPVRSPRVHGQALHGYRRGRAAASSAPTTPAATATAASSSSTRRARCDGRHQQRHRHHPHAERAAGDTPCGRRLRDHGARPFSVPQLLPEGPASTGRRASRPPARRPGRSSSPTASTRSSATRMRPR
jgi:hypothetical protein